MRVTLLFGYTEFSTNAGARVTIISISFDIMTIGNIGDQFETTGFRPALTHQNPYSLFVYQPPISRSGLYSQPHRLSFAERLVLDTPGKTHAAANTSKRMAQPVV